MGCVVGMLGARFGAYLLHEYAVVCIVIRTMSAVPPIRAASLPPVRGLARP